MPVKWGAGSGESTVGAFGAATFVLTGGSGTFEDPYTGVYYLEVANFNAAEYDVELPFTVPMSFRVKRLSMMYIGGAPGVILFPTFKVYYAAASTEFPWSVPQVTTLATDQLVWEDGPWVPLRNGAVDGAGVLANLRGALTVNHTNYAATDDYRVAIELEWVNG